MTNAEEARTPALLDLLSKIEEHAHKLSNSVGCSMNLLVLQIREADDLAPERIIQAAALATQAAGTLQKLMWELHRVRSLVEATSSKCR